MAVNTIDKLQFLSFILIIVLLQIYQWIYKCKNFENWLAFG